jgi:hypothetical protein
MIKSRRMRRAEHEACIGAKISAIRILVEKHEGNRLPVRPIHRWEDNFKMGLR